MSEPDSQSSTTNPSPDSNATSDQQHNEKSRGLRGNIAKALRRLQSYGKPSTLQSKTMWWALTFFSGAVIAVLAVAFIWLALWLLGQLRPVLVPLCVAGVLAFILDPVVGLFTKWGMSRKWASTLVVISFVLLILTLVSLVIVPTVSQLSEVKWEETGKKLVITTSNVLKDFQDKLSSLKPPSLTDPSTPSVINAVPTAPETPSFSDAWNQISEKKWFKDFFSTDTLGSIGVWIKMHLGSVTSLFSYLIFPILVPFYLWFILCHSAKIGSNWQNWLPLRRSMFRDEFVDTVNEIINNNLKPYFRGQMVVSIINATLTGIGLMILGLDYAPLIAVCMVFLCLLPMIGIILCAIPAMLIALVQYSQPSEQFASLPYVWAYPLIVLGIFVLVQQIDGWLITPRVIGHSTGLSDFEVIFSILLWSHLLGGFVGALLAVPLTASIKVIHLRYIGQVRKRQAESEVEEEPLTSS